MSATLNFDDLLSLSARASQRVRELHAELRHVHRGDPYGAALVERIEHWKRVEREARKRVRAHPDHTYEGL